VDHVYVWTQKERKCLRYTRIRTRPKCELFGISRVFPQKKNMITRQADAYKPIYLGMTNVVNVRPSTMRAGFYPKPNQEIFLVHKVALVQVLLRELPIPP